MSEQRREWARRYMAAAPDAPAYGTREWLALPEGSAKVAAVVRAAECWATEGDELHPRLRAQLEAEQWAWKVAEDEDWIEHGREHELAWDPKLPGFRHDPRGEAEREREWLEFVAGGEPPCQDALTRPAS